MGRLLHKAGAKRGCIMGFGSAGKSGKAVLAAERSGQRVVLDRAVSDRGVPVRIKRPMASRLRLPDSAASPLDRAVEISFNI